MSIRLKYRYAKRSYASRRWPVTLRLLPSQTSPEITQHGLYECCLMAGLSQPKVTRQKTGISHKAIKAVAADRQAIMRLNSYHNQQHIAQVILAAGMLADYAQITQIERDLLIVAALIHDFAHLGRFRNRKAMWQERQSVTKAMPILLRHGCDSRLVTLFEEMILATSPAHKGQEADIKDNDILSLLLDADLFASLFLPKKQVSKLTSCLKYEDRLHKPMAELRDSFISSCQRRGFASSVAQRLHDSLPPDMTFMES